MSKYFKGIGADFSSSIVVFLVAIPLCLGIAVASGVNEFSGIIAGIVGGVVVGAISGSHLSVSGPAAGLTAVVAAGIMKLPSVEAFFLAVVIAGLIQFIMGIIKLGLIGDYIPNNVIKGMLAAIGIILILKQLPHLVGYDKNYEGDEDFIQNTGDNTFSSILDALNSITPNAVFIGVVGLLVLLVFESPRVKAMKIFQIISGPLVVVVLGAFLNQILNGTDHALTLRDAHLVNMPVAKSATDFFGFFHFPEWSAIKNPQVWVVGTTIALVASLETLLGIEAVDKLDPMKRVSPPNRELLAQGAGNVISGLLGGLPLTSVIVRSSANVNAGAQTKNSAIFHGLLIFIFVAFFPGLMNMIPKAALAAILIFTGYKLAKLSIFKSYYKMGWEQFVPFVVTIVCIIATDLLKGVVVGMIVSFFYVIRSNFRSAVFYIQDGDDILIRLRKDVSFFIKPILKQKLERVPANTNLLIDVFHAEHMDRDVIDVINDYIKHASMKNIHVVLKKNPHNKLHRLLDAVEEKK
jgi:MFS superfamily sulfate permease-like transporter